MVIEHSLLTGSRESREGHPPLLADIHRDMAAIFGEPDGAMRHEAPHARSIRLEQDRKAGPRAAGRRSAGPILAAGMGGLLLGMAAIAVPGLSGRNILLPRAAGAPPALVVAANPFEEPRPAARTEPAEMAARTTPPAPAAPEPTPPKPPMADPGPAAKMRLADRRVQEPPAKPFEDAEEKPVETAAKPECEGDRLERVWCMSHDILEADRRLRRAYANAIQEGVERRFLVEHQRRWSRLRSRASSDPAGVLEGYGELADDLERLAINGRRADRAS